jgi:hypothetical protein
LGGAYWGGVEGVGLAIGGALIATGIAISVMGVCGLIICGDRVENLCKDGMREVCEEASAMHTGVSFHVRERNEFLGYEYRGGNRVRVKTNCYIEVNVSDTHDLPTDQEYNVSAPSALVYPSAVAIGITKAPEERMRELENMKGILTEDEYQQKRAQILSDI